MSQSDASYLRHLHYHPCSDASAVPASRLVVQVGSVAAVVAAAVAAGPASGNCCNSDPSHLVAAAVAAGGSWSAWNLHRLFRDT